CTAYDGVAYDEDAELGWFEHSLDPNENGGHLMQEGLGRRSLLSFGAVFAMRADLFALKTRLVKAKPLHTEAMIQMVTVGIGIRRGSHYQIHRFGLNCFDVSCVYGQGHDAVRPGY